MMSDPRIWYLFVALFVVAGAIHLARGLTSCDERRPVRLTLAAVCVVWGAAAGLFRFAGIAPAGAAAAVALALTLYAGFVSAGAQKEQPPKA